MTMTNREEQIYKAADKATYQTPPQYSELVHKSRKAMCAYEVGFIDGCVWADQHHQWIPVEERLPEKDNEFEDYSKLVIVTNGKDFWKGMYNYGGEVWLTFDLWQIDDATHWMEFVPPRKEEVRYDSTRRRSLH